MNLNNDEFWKIKAKLHIYNKILDYFIAEHSKLQDERKVLRQKINDMLSYMSKNSLNISIMKRLFDISKTIIRKSLS